MDDVAPPRIIDEPTPDVQPELPSAEGTAPAGTSTQDPKQAKPSTDSPRKCPHSTGDPKQPFRGRNLVVCLDGTANQFSNQNTNVVELYNRLVKDENQLTYYNSGIGTYAKRPPWHPGSWRRTISHIIDMAIAWNFERIVLDAYRWLCDNYQEGDRICLYGFSRGAYQARVIAGMIEVVGLLHRGNDAQIPFAFEIYMATTDRPGRTQESSTKANQEVTESAGDSQPRDVPGAYPTDKIPEYFPGAWAFVFASLCPSWLLFIFNILLVAMTVITAPLLLILSFIVTLLLGSGNYQDAARLCQIFKRTFSRPDVVVHLVGIWDTVSSIGFARNPSLPETNTGMGHVCYCCHALALDECRVKFLPEYAGGGVGPSTDKDNVKEVWFAGTHSDIGGGNKSNITLDTFGPSLRWMIYESIKSGLRFTSQISPTWAVISAPTPSLTSVWKVLEMLPLKRLSYEDKESTTSRHVHRRTEPHRGECRQVKARQKIHESVFRVMKQHGYIPLASIEGEAIFNAAQALEKKWKEADPYTSAGTILSAIDKADPAFGKRLLSNQDLFALENLVSTNSGKQSIIDNPDAARILVQALRRANASATLPTSLSSIESLLLAALLALPEQPSWSLIGTRSELRTLVRRGKIQNDAGVTLLRNIAARHTDRVNELAIAPRGDFFASCSDDGTIRIWDLQTAEAIGDPIVLKGENRGINGVAISPDGTWIVSGGDDNAVRIWSMETRKELRKLTGHTHWVWSVAISPDGTRIVSGSSDDTIRIWDAATDDAVGKPLGGHTDDINCVRISTDGTRIVSGSDDKTVRVWDTQTGAELMKLEEHTHMVWSVAISPDGTRIASASSDCTVRLWDAATGGQVWRYLMEGEYCLSVAFSPDGHRVVVGTDKADIYVWDVETGARVLGPLHGHTSWIRSVVISPDGKRIYSGSQDHTIRAWSMETGEELKFED